MSQELRLVAVLDLKPNSWEHVKNAVKECVKQSRLEAGNFFYSAHFEENNQNRVVFIEHWMSREAIETHSQTAHFKQLVQIIGPYLEQPMQLLTLAEIQEIGE
ncbi:putative quinol monooxygenase [Commensalibacter oyaizuii]|uniref:Quinol monooxygenase n=1 Tax=Commensalibacter oyaizuii TaxID=3043873 RepID=A0ABT6Q1M2_9PROT|nr:putative quinol monooxygenase [Commensalibacter sp. TBRC 16381]MDI2091012.1 putative quinol monooxygenase [Commensalibacter sp. TBRC 16381]